MAENDWNPFADATRQFTEGQNQFTRMWTDFAGKMGAAGMSFTPESTPPDAAKQMRAAFLKAWSEHCDEYMRSSEFLDSWKKTMDAAIQWRRQMNESMGRMQHEMGGTSRQDVDQLMMAMSHLERRLVDNLERSAERMEDLAGRLEEVERRLNGGGGVSRAAGGDATATRKAAKKALRKAAKNAKKAGKGRKRPATKKMTARRKK